MSDYTSLGITTKDLLLDALDALTSRQALNAAAMDAAKRRYGLPWIPPALKADLAREHRNIEHCRNRLDDLNDDMNAIAAEADRTRWNGGSPHVPIRRPPGPGYVGLTLVECQRRMQRKIREVMRQL